MKRGLLILAIVLAQGGGLALAQQGSEGASSEPAKDEQRVALVIGNSAYTRISRLKNPANDARAMAQVLEFAGFQVTTLVDTDRRGMLRAIERFGRKLRNGGVGLFYFAGHGVQARGRNYLVPLGAVVEGEPDLEYEAVDAGRVLAKMENARNRLNIVILDACRNNPYRGAFRSLRNGLAQVNAPSGTLVAYATGPGKVAADGGGRNGLYTQQLIRHINTPGLKLEEVFKRVRGDVRRLSGGKQVPWENTSVEGDFYFTRGDSPAPPVVARAQPPAFAKPAPTLDEEEEFWKVIKNSTNAEEYKAYLKEYPTGRFSTIARIKLKRLQKTKGSFSRSSITIREGKYSVQGINPNGSRYTGSVTIRLSESTYHFRWQVGSQVFVGTGKLKGKTLTVQWGSKYPVIYQVMDGGDLQGTWANGRARENLKFAQ